MTLAIRSNSLIPRFPLPLYHRTKVPDSSSPIVGMGGDTYEIVTEVAEQCTLQPVKPQQLSADLEGISTNDIFVLRTNTPLYPVGQGTNFLGSGIYLPASYFTVAGAAFVPENLGGYYNCLEVKHWNNGVIPHFKAIVQKDYTLEEDAYPYDKVAQTAADMDTVTKLKAGDWTTGWVS